MSRTKWKHIETIDLIHQKSNVFAAWIGWWVGVNSCWLLFFSRALSRLCKRFFDFWCEPMWVFLLLQGDSCQANLNRETFIESRGLTLMFATKQRVAHVHWILPSWLQPCDNANASFSRNFFTILWDLHGSAMKRDETAHVWCCHVQFWLGLVGQQWPWGHWQLSAPDKSSGEGHDNLDNHEKRNNKRKSRLKQAI